MMVGMLKASDYQCVVRVFCVGQAVILICVLNDAMSLAMVVILGKLLIINLAKCNRH